MRMPEARYSIGVDFGTNSVRAVVVDTSNGQIVGTAVHAYRRGEEGVILDSHDVNLARQHPLEYTEGFCAAMSGAMDESGVDAAQIVGIGIDTTGSTPIPVDRHGDPLGFDGRFQSEPAAMAWLWKDHTGHAEAEEITALANRQGRPYLEKCGGTYSSEWFWSKILRCARTAPTVFESAHSWMECADFVPAWATGTLAHPKRGVCAAGHKAMFHSSWGGLPEADFLFDLDPRLADLRTRLFDEAVPSDHIAGHLTKPVADACGLLPGIPVAVGAFDAHMGAVGSGVKPGTLVKIVGTSTCDILVGPPEAGEPSIPGVCGVVPGSVIPGLVGIEAGQSAVGDLFNWFVRFSGRSHEELTADALQLSPGSNGLLALDWNNGNRTILVDPRLSGLLVGQSLHTTPAEVYRALVEATAFGALTIIRRIESCGVAIDEVVNCGGIAEKSALTMQIYADVCNRPMKVAGSPQTCALGAAIFGAVAGGAHVDVLSAQAAMVPPPNRIYQPDPAAAWVYEQLYGLYATLHDAFGAVRQTDLGGVMKELIRIREEVRSR
jgi:L-ribulokinase